ncbi:MAG: hypothetical protein C0418_03280 [Coriobacteriaceae bacterium]|nr:hypothetical protein [Coriobacteriaceae bacterium]
MGVGDVLLVLPALDERVEQAQFVDRDHGGDVRVVSRDERALVRIGGAVDDIGQVLAGLGHTDSCHDVPPVRNVQKVHDEPDLVQPATWRVSTRPRRGSLDVWRIILHGVNDRTDARLRSAQPVDSVAHLRGAALDRTITVVIPALDEAARLPGLLDALERQTRRPDAVILADAGSIDGTREIAAARDVLVVDGGRPAAGRNAGARVATTDLILFLDADVVLEDGAIAAMLDEFAERDLVVASAFIEPVERDAAYVFACEVVNFYLEVMQYVAPHAPGFCILATREVHEAIGGFDEDLMLAEDHDYVTRAAEHGRFRMLRSVRVRTSMRRIAKEGLVRLAFKYLYCELLVMTGQRIVEAPFDYEFAAFGPVESVESRGAVAVLRERLSTLSETLQVMSVEGRDALREIGETEIDLPLLERALARVRTDDVRALEHYVSVRVRLVRRGQARVLGRVRRAAGSIWRELTRSAG